MSTGSIVFYQSFKEKLVEGFNMGSDTFRVGLTSSSYTPSASSHTALADITNELSGSGYARQALTITTSSQSSGTFTWDADNVVFTASGGSITGRYYFIFNDTDASDSLVCYGLLDTTPADVTATDGNTLTIQWNASGIFTLA
jgi:hypothetical protein